MRLQNERKENLGFNERTTIYEYTVRTLGDPGWLLFERDNCIIMAGECPDALPPSELGDHSYFAYIVVSWIDDFYRSVQDKGANS